MENRSDAVLSGKLSDTVVGIFFILIFFLFDSNRAMGQNTEDDIPDPSLIQYGFISDTVPVNLENSTVLVTLRNGYKLLDRTSANRVLKSMYNESDIPVHVAGIILPSADADNADFSKAFLIQDMRYGTVVQKGKVDFKRLLESFKRKAANDSISLSWAFSPGYDQNNRNLWMPLMSVHQTDTLLNYVNLLFGRYGWIELRNMNPYIDREWVRMNAADMAATLSFENTYKYQDIMEDDLKNPLYTSVENFLYDIKNDPAADSEESDYENSGIFSGAIPAVLNVPLLFFLAVAAVLYIISILTASRKDSERGMKRAAFSEVMRMGVFMSVYLALILLAISLCWAGVWFSIELFPVYLSFYGIAMLIAAWGLIITFTVFVIRPLFNFKNPSDPFKIEIQEKDAPELFSLIRETAAEAGVSFPNKVFVSHRANASVFYDLRFWSIFFPSKKNIELGLGLLNGLSVDELKAVIGHEFGHFGQSTMKVGNIVSIGTQIIGNIVQCREDETGFLISNARKVMGYLYMFVEKGFLGLSRKMEYDADRVSANIVGNDSMISSLYKIKVIINRFEAYNSLFERIAEQKQVLPVSYWSGYSLFVTLSDRFDGIRLEAKTPMYESSGITSESRIEIKNPWISHPSDRQRIDKIRSGVRDSVYRDPREANILVPDEIWKKVSDNLISLAGADRFKRISDDQYYAFLKTDLEERSFPLHLRPYFNRDIVSFEIDMESVQTNVDNPMDDEDGLLITEYIQAVSDYEIMKQFMENKIGQRRIRYIDKVYSRKNIPLDDQLSYLESVATKVGKIDRSVCEYAMGLSDDPQRILQAYDDIFYSQNAVEKIKYVLFWQRDDLTKELMKGKTRDENEFDMLKGRLSSFKEEIQRMIYSLEMRRLVPVIHHQMWDNLMIIKDDKYYFALNSTQISGEDINTIFAIPDELVNLFESLAYYSKKIVSDTIEGKTPLMYWENSVAEKESVSIQEAVERCSM